MSANAFSNRQTDGAIGDILKSRAIDQAASLKVNAASPKQKKIRRYLREAAQAINSGNYRDAGSIALKALDLDEHNGLGNHIAAIAMDKLDQVQLALQLYQRALNAEPANVEIYQNLGLLAWRMDQLELAEKFFRLQLELDPTSPDAANNLGCVLRDNNKFDAAIEVLRAGIYSDASNAMLWTAMGSTMVEMRRLDEALQFQNEAERLEPSSAKIQHNLGYAHYIAGNAENALVHFNKAKTLKGLLPEEGVISEHARALALLAAGHLEEAWDAYEVRCNRLYPQATAFDMAAPRWNGEDLTGKKLLLMGEQGLGDEILFMSMMNDLIDQLGPDGELGISCQDRLVTLVSRSFPQVEVKAHKTIQRDGRNFRGVPELEGGKDYDYWVELATPLKLLRTNHQAFKQPAEGFFTPDPNRVVHWTSVLEDLGPDLKAGVLWKSQLMNVSRSKYFSPFDAWKPVLQTPGVTWINLQYGECDEELAKAKEQFGVDIHVLPGIDLKNDLDDLAALTRALNLVAGPMNATTNIAGAVGTDIWLAWAKTAWTMLGRGELLWYPNTRLFAPEDVSNWSGAMTDMANALGQRVGQTATQAA